MKKWKPSVCFGWFRGNLPVGIRLSIFEPIGDYPVGWVSVILFGLWVGRAELTLMIDKKGYDEKRNI
jgi:hypothetical protein